MEYHWKTLIGYFLNYLGQECASKMILIFYGITICYGLNTMAR